MKEIELKEPILVKLKFNTDSEYNLNIIPQGKYEIENINKEYLCFDLFKNPFWLGHCLTNKKIFDKITI